MPVPAERVVLDSSLRLEQSPPLRSQIRASANIVPVEPSGGSSDSPDRQLVVPVISEAQAAEQYQELRAREEFEDARLEEETRLALTVERIEIDQRPQNAAELERSIPVIAIGSLRIDVIV